MSLDQDRPCTCMFYFADGRRCQLPPSLDDSGLCYYHAKKFRDRLNTQEIGTRINQLLSREVLTANDLSITFATLFSATAQGLVKPKAAAALAYLGQLMLQTQRLAKQEYLEAFETSWPEVVQDSFTLTPANPQTAPDSDSAEDSAENPPSDPANPRAKIM